MELMEVEKEKSITASGIVFETDEQLYRPSLLHSNDVFHSIVSLFYSAFCVISTHYISMICIWVLSSRKIVCIAALISLREWYLYPIFVYLQIIFFDDIIIPLKRFIKLIVSPDHLPDVENHLRTANIEYTVVIDDIKRYFPESLVPLCFIIVTRERHI